MLQRVPLVFMKTHEDSIFSARENRFRFSLLEKIEPQVSNNHVPRKITMLKLWNFTTTEMI